MPRLLTANAIINRVAIEVGLNADQDPVSSNGETYVQLKGLLDSCGQELVNLHDWQELRNVLSFTTSSADSGTYELPDDFDHMINQTGWDRSNNFPVGGPLSAQTWTYLEGRDLVSQTIYASFRLVDNKLDLFPQPPPDGLEVSFEYISRNWVQENTTEDRRDIVEQGSDYVLYDPLLMIRFLKLKYLWAKGLPSQGAAIEFDTMLEARKAKSTGAQVLNVARGASRFPYLDAFHNTGDTGYG